MLLRRLEPTNNLITQIATKFIVLQSKFALSIGTNISNYPQAIDSAGEADDCARNLRQQNFGVHAWSTSRYSRPAPTKDEVSVSEHFFQP